MIRIELDERQELVEYLVGLGATPEDLESYRDQLPALAMVVLLRPGREQMTLSEVAERSGVPLQDVLSLWRAAGFADPDPDARVSSDAEVGLFQAFQASLALLPKDAVIQFTRVIGMSLARIADAAVSTFLVNASLPFEGVSELEAARATQQGAALFPALSQAMDVLLRRHLIAAQRLPIGPSAGDGAETQQLAVGFVDLVGSTALAERLAIAQLGAALRQFEERAYDTVASSHGRVVKLLGDGVMYVNTEPEAAATTGLELAGAFTHHTVLPPARVGLAWGDVLLRDGDCFGPTVNVASRLVRVAEPNTVVITEALRGALSARHSTRLLGPAELPGITHPVDLWVLES
jgi:adenylate cyclase